MKKFLSECSYKVVVDVFAYDKFDLKTSIDILKRICNE